VANVACLGSVCAARCRLCAHVARAGKRAGRRRRTFCSTDQRARVAASAAASSRWPLTVSAAIGK